MNDAFFKDAANPSMAGGPGPVHVMENCFDENQILFVGNAFIRNTIKLKKQQWCLSLILLCTMGNQSTAARQSQKQHRRDACNDFLYMRDDY